MSVTGNPDVKWTVQLNQTGVGTTPNNQVVKVPGWVNELSIGLRPNGTTAGVEITLSDEADIDAGTAIWFLWDPGQVTANTLRGAVGPVTGVRINQSVGAGTSTLFLAAQRPRV